jgi:RNA polymerase sigma-70 factor (ECF subfamily)
MTMNEHEKIFKEITGFDFNSYFKEYYPKISKYLTKRHTKNEDKSNEYTQRAFIQALEKIESYEPLKSKLVTWITRIAINILIADWKNEQKYDSVSIDAEFNDMPNFTNIIKHDDGEYERTEYADNKKKCEIILSTIDVLPEKYKKVIIMREVEKMHYKDIAEKVKKLIKINLNFDYYKLPTPEDLYSIDITNNGDKEVVLHFTNGVDIYSQKIKPFHSFFVLREDIHWERLNTDLFNIDSSLSVCEIRYTTTTNLSTIKSQIKKGRNLIRKKVRNKFLLLENA